MFTCFQIHIASWGSLQWYIDVHYQKSFQTTLPFCRIPKEQHGSSFTTLQCNRMSMFSIYCYCRTTCLPPPLPKASTRRQARNAPLKRSSRFLPNGYAVLAHGSFATRSRVSPWEIWSNVCRFRQNILYSWFNYFFLSISITVLVVIDTFLKEI